MYITTTEKEETMFFNHLITLSKSMLIPKPAKVHFWFSFLSLIFVYFNAFFNFFQQYIINQACSHCVLGFLSLKIV